MHLIVIPIPLIIRRIFLIWSLLWFSSLVYTSLRMCTTPQLEYCHVMWTFQLFICLGISGIVYEVMLVASRLQVQSHAALVRKPQLGSIVQPCVWICIKISVNSSQCFEKRTNEWMVFCTKNNEFCFRFALGHNCLSGIVWLQ